MTTRIKANELVVGTWYYYYNDAMKKHFYVENMDKNSNVVYVFWGNNNVMNGGYNPSIILADAYLAPVHNFKQQLKEWVKQ